MAKNKNARLGAGTPRQAAGKTLDGHFPISNHSIAPPRAQGLYCLLGTGEAAALSARELSRIIGSKPREVSREIERLRLSGVPICAGKSGYFLPADAAELQRYTRGFDRRLRSIRLTREALGAALDKLSGQETLGGCSNG